jgi:hypothetical protein
MDAEAEENPHNRGATMGKRRVCLELSLVLHISVSISRHHRLATEASRPNDGGPITTGSTSQDLGQQVRPYDSVAVSLRNEEENSDEDVAFDL